jgi:hypothetical protein
MTTKLLSLAAGAAMMIAASGAANAEVFTLDGHGNVTSSWPGEGLTTACGKFTIDGASTTGLPFYSINTTNPAGVALWAKVLQAETFAKLNTALGIHIPSTLYVTLGETSVICNNGDTEVIAVAALTIGSP